MEIFYVFMMFAVFIWSILKLDVQQTHAGKNITAAIIFALLWPLFITIKFTYWVMGDG